MMVAPCSSYSCLEIQSCWKEPSEARIDPPIHTENRRSCGVGGDMSLTFIDICGTSSFRRPCSRSVRPGSNEVPPLTTIDPQSSRRMSVSHERMQSATSSGSPTVPSGTIEASSAADAESGGGSAAAPSAEGAAGGSERSHGGGACRRRAGLKRSSGTWKRSQPTSRTDWSGSSYSHVEPSSGEASVGCVIAQRHTHSLASRSNCTCACWWNDGCVFAKLCGSKEYSSGPTCDRLRL
mmetsp:Transcript_28610/g.77499  ORF Transcript_28610/g.77499 Transcript_28610/m.77499 type:complete len:237 (-) Transcript_28610:123-833(-)